MSATTSTPTRKSPARVALRAAPFLVASALTVAALSRPGRVVAEGEGRTLVAVVDRSASLHYADPKGDGRAALAFALALAAHPSDQVVVTAPQLDPPVGGPANDLASLQNALRTIVRPPAEAGGADLAPTFASAVERAESRGAVIIYTADELDVVDAGGHAPDAALEAARQKTARPDRTGVNEAARDALGESLAALRDGKRLFGLRAPLPAEAHAVPFLEAIGARAVDFDPKQPLVTARALAVLLGRIDLPSAPGEIALDDGTGKLDVASGTRVVLAGRAGFNVRAAAAIALDPDQRFWVVDADGPLDVTGKAGEKIAWLGASRTPLALELGAWRLASGKIQVSARPSVAHAALTLTAVSGGGGGAPVELTKSPGGGYAARLPASPDATTVGVEARFGSLVLPAVVAPIVRAVLTLAPTADSALVVGAPVTLTAKTAGKLPPELLADELPVTLAHGSQEVKSQLASEAGVYQGKLEFPSAGRFTLTSTSAGELALELASDINIVAAPVLTVARQGEPGPIVVRDGRATFEVEVSLSPAPARPASLVVRLDGLRDATAELSGGAAASGTPSRCTVFLSAKPERLEACSLELEAQLPAGVRSRAKLPVELKPPLGWQKWAALGVTAVALLWAVVAWRRKKALARLWGEKQLRGLGPSGKITPERYPLKGCLVSRRSAVVTVGRTSVVIDLAADGAATARAPEGVEILKLEKGSKRGAELALEHGLAFAVLRDPSIRRFVYLERDPTADELARRYVPEARSFTEEEQEQHSDLYVLLEEGENVSAASERLVGGKSARIGHSARFGRGESGRTGASERLGIDQSQIRGDSARVVPGDSARIPEAIPRGSASDEPIIVVSDEGQLLDDGEVVVLNPGSSDETEPGKKAAREPAHSEGEHAALETGSSDLLSGSGEALEVDVTGPDRDDAGPSEHETSYQDALAALRRDGLGGSSDGLPSSDEVSTAKSQNGAEPRNGVALADDSIEAPAKKSAPFPSLPSSDERPGTAAVFDGKGSTGAFIDTGSSDEIEPIVDPGSSDDTGSDDTVSSEGDVVIPSTDLGNVEPAGDED